MDVTSNSIRSMDYVVSYSAKDGVFAYASTKAWLNSLDLYTGKCFCCKGFLSACVCELCVCVRETILLSPERRTHTRPTLSLSH